MRSNEIVDPFIAQEHSLNDFLIIASKIRPGIPERIIQVHNTYLSDIKQKKHLIEKYLDPDAKVEDYTIELLIASALRYAFSLGNLLSAIETYKKYRRDTKRNWVKSLEKEASKNPVEETTIHKAASTIYMANELDPTKDDHRTIDEIKQDIIKSIETWRSDLNAPVCSYQLLKTKPAHSVCTALFHDIVLESLLILNEKADEIFTDDNVKVPKQLHQYPVVSLSQTPSIISDFIMNEVTLSSQYSNVLEDSHLKVDVTMNVPAPPNYNEQSQIKELDTRDQDIITRIFSRFTPGILENKRLTLNMIEFAKEVYGVEEPKKRNYEDLMERMRKLAGYTYDITVTDTESGDVIEKTVLSMLSYMRMNTIDKTIEVQPSDQLISSYIQKNFITISSDTYNRIPNNKTRVFMMLLQEQRILEYSKKSVEKTLSLSFFRSRLKTNKMSNTLLRKEITTHLDALVENNCVISSYNFINKKSSVKVLFLPLTEAELSAYGKADDSVIDADFKEMN